jgi:peptidoglycan/LPS O-acetylase OafA/YrhL
MQKAQKNHFIGLEWLRFLLGFYVMVYHTIHRYPQRFEIPFLSELTTLGFFATSTFFILSGFLLTHVYFSGNTMREPAGSFLAKRFCNLYPIHIFGLLSYIAVISLLQWLDISPDAATASARFVIYDTNSEMPDPTQLQHLMSNSELVVNGLLQMFMLHAWNPFYLTFNAPLWSISTLFFFYLTFPFLAPRLLTVRRLWWLLLGICLLYLIPPVWVIWQHLYGIPYTGLLQRGPLLRLPEFLAGILTYALFRRHQQQGLQLSKISRGWLALTVTLCFVVAAQLYSHGARYWYFLLHNGLLLPAQLCLVYLCATVTMPKSANITRWAKRLGSAALPIFALHVPLSILFRILEQMLRGAPSRCISDWQYCVAQAGLVTPSVWVYLGYLLFTVVFCVAFQKYFVIPVRQYLLQNWFFKYAAIR